MTPLRQRMLDALVLHGKAARTQQAYIDAVASLARHYRRSPDQLSADEVQRYLLHLLRERHLARSSVNQYGCAFRFLYGNVLGLDGVAFQIPLAAAPQRLPEILSRAEIAALLECAPHLKARALLSCGYALGLRVSELCALRPEHIDSAADRMCVRVVQGKGARDRYVPLSAELLARLSQLAVAFARIRSIRARKCLIHKEAVGANACGEDFGRCAWEVGFVECGACSCAARDARRTASSTSTGASWRTAA